MPTTTITTVRTVAIPAADQDRSVAFFVERLGFEKRLDAELAPGFRWIEVAPPGSPVSIAIVTASDALPAGVDTGIRFVTTDAEAEHASMAEHGVEVGEVLRWPGVPAMFSFRDVDGNTFYLAEPGR
jgi:catechol 2,3-dioxygenase-like lactoylglutathione lyase family enzyme